MRAATEGYELITGARDFREIQRKSSRLYGLSGGSSSPRDWNQYFVEEEEEEGGGGGTQTEKETSQMKN